MMSPWRLLLLGLLALRLLGGDLALLQGLAWVGMLLERAPEKGLAQAVESTFSGDEPCDLCRAIKKTKDAESASEPVQAPQEEKLPAGLIAKLKLKEALPLEELPSMPESLPLNVAKARRSLDGERAATRSDAPPSPPPRAGEMVLA